MNMKTFIVGCIITWNFFKTEDQRDEAIIIIRNGLVKHGQIADPEINLSATLVELELLTRQT